MKKVGVLVLILLASPTWGQLPENFVFSDPDNPQNATVDNRPIFRDLTPNPPRQADSSLSPYINGETVTAEKFFRNIWSGINRRSNQRASRMQARFNFTDDEEQVLNIFLSDWVEKSAEEAQHSTMKMCEYWAQPGLEKDYETALQALDVKTAHRPTIDEFWHEINELTFKIEQRMGSDMADLLVTELEKDLSTRADTIGYDTMESFARARGNALEQVNSVCHSPAA